MPELTPEQEQELRRLLEPRPPSYSGLEGIPRDTRNEPRGYSTVPQSEPPIPLNRSYRMTQDPYLAASEQGDRQQVVDSLGLALQGADPFQVRSSIAGPQGLPGWDQDPSQGGLGLAGGLGTEQKNQREYPEDILARELFGPNVNLGFWDRVRLRHNMANGGMMQALGRREQVAHQAQQLEEQKRQHDFEQATKIFTDHNMPWSQRKKLLQANQGNPVARIYANIGDEKLAADFENVVQYLDPQDVAAFEKDPDGFVRSVGGLAGVEAKLETANERRQMKIKERETTAKERQQAVEIDELFAKYRQDPAAMSEAELGRLDEYTRAREKRKLDMQELDQRIKNLGLEEQHKRLGLARDKAPIISPHFTVPSGESAVYKTDPVTGKQELISGVPQSKQQITNVAPTAIEHMVDSRTMLDQIKQLEESYKKEYVGPIDNLWASMKEKAPGVFGPIGKDEATFRKKVNQVVLSAKKLFIGTAQSKAETEGFVEAYMNLGQNDTVFESAISGLREMTRTSLQARSRLMAEIAAGQKKPMTITERAAQLSELVNVKGFAADAKEAQKIASDTLLEEIQLGIVKGY